MLKLTPIGGIGEIGMNMFSFEYGGHNIFIDCGVLFPPFQHLGVEAVLVDYKELIKRFKKIDSIFITHGHEDHIGGIPYLLKELKPRIYATPYASELINYRAVNVLGAKFKTGIKEVLYGTVIKDGPFEVEYIKVDHSIPDASALFIKVGKFRILYVADFRLNGDNKSSFLSRIKKIRNEGEIDILLSDSTNASGVENTSGEQAVLHNMNKYFKVAKGAIVVTLFSSHVERVNQVISLCKKHNKSLFISGHNLKNHVSIARKLGYLEPDNGCIKPDSEISRTKKKNTVFLCTGSQAERNSSIVRLSHGMHSHLKIEQDDMVIFSSSMIPGNEKLIMNVINRLAERGADVVYSNDVHCSGHADSNELRMVLKEVRPKYFIPVHGEFIHLKDHINIAIKEGVRPEHCFMLRNGDEVISEKTHFVVQKNDDKMERLYLDSMSRSLIGKSIIKERAMMGEKGIINVVIVAGDNNKLFKKPKIFMYGIAVEHNLVKLVESVEKKVEEFIISNRKNKKLPNMVDDIKQLVKREIRKVYDDKPEVLVNLL